MSVFIAFNSGITFNHGKKQFFPAIIGIFKTEKEAEKHAFEYLTKQKDFKNWNVEISKQYYSRFRKVLTTQGLKDGLFFHNNLSSEEKNFWDEFSEEELFKLVIIENKIGKVFEFYEYFTASSGYEEAKDLYMLIKGALEGETFAQDTDYLAEIYQMELTKNS